MAEKPIIFSGESVRAILEGKKTQTRRAVSKGNSILGSGPGWQHLNFDAPHPAVLVDNGYLHVPCHSDEQGHYLESGSVVCEECTDNWDGTRHRVYSRIEVGTRLWVRETWCEGDHEPCDCLPSACPHKPHIEYRADWSGIDGDVRWKSPLFMPRWASRLTLEVTDVRVERVADISAKDIMAEGVVLRSHNVDAYAVIGENPKCPVAAFDGCVYPDLRSVWAASWDHINGKRGFPFASNPWCWAYTFKAV